MKSQPLAFACHFNKIASAPHPAKGLHNIRRHFGASRGSRGKFVAGGGTLGGDGRRGDVRHTFFVLVKVGVGEKGLYRGEEHYNNGNE